MTATPHHSKPQNAPDGGKTYARTLQDLEVYHAVLNAVIEIPAGTRVEVLAVTATNFFGMYTEGAADCVVQGPADEFESCEAESPDDFRTRGIAAIRYLAAVQGEVITDEQAAVEWDQTAARDRVYVLKFTERTKLKKAKAV